MRHLRVIAPALLLLACGVPPEVVSDDLTDLPLAGLSDDWRARFDEGGLDRVGNRLGGRRVGGGNVELVLAHGGS